MEISFEKVEHTYQQGTPFERRALYDVNVFTKTNQLVSVIGHTGSGKSTFIQHINALLRPTSGAIRVGDLSITSSTRKKDIRLLRKKVGIVFQHPEQQLFAETVEEDICFGPINIGFTKEEAIKKAKEALKYVGLHENVLKKSPFDLSGGQMRRVAIAGILAMEPELLVLDEPTAGLDPLGKKTLMTMFYKMKQEKDMTIYLVTHNMEDAAIYSDDIIIMNKGTVFLQGTPTEIFNQPEILHDIGLDIPESLQLLSKLEEKFNMKLNVENFSNEGIIDTIKKLINKGAVPS